MKKTRTLKSLQVQALMNRLFLSSLLFLLLACEENTLYHSFHPVDTTGWKRNDTLIYTIPSSVLSNNPQAEIGIRHKDSYPYRDIWLSISHLEKTDTIHIYMANVNGSWKGHGIGETRQYSETIANLRLRDATDSIFTLKLVHIMQDSILTGINDIGIHFKKEP